EPVRKVLDYEKVYQQARKDPLTDLPNRLFFNEHIDSLIELANRHNRPFTIAALDLDHFKQINDTKGHMEGDQVLQQIAATLKKEIRLSDNLIRTGGDEFLLTLQETDLEASRHLCTRLCQSIEGLDIHTEQTKLCLSIGLATYRSDLTLEQLLTHADNMLYKAKANGGNSVVG
ncbi:MAG: GGDEF domain-containing protein, partial [Desulfobulbaceae bacterium]|nr:GGDEF domain-containing protein [Desulfobulbaceae bacterium]